jgi:hypothetical protein
MKKRQRGAYLRRAPGVLLLIALPLFLEIPLSLQKTEPCLHDLSIGNQHQSEEGMQRSVYRDSAPTRNPNFVFVLGTEGSGHHLWALLIEHSPHLKTLIELGLLEEAQRVSYQLYDKLNLRRSLFGGAPCDQDWNGTLVLEQTAHKLKILGEKLPLNVTVPLNGLVGTGLTSGMMSYPNFKKGDTGCVPLRYPNVLLLHKACQQARVSCQFIVQYRDPLAVLRSTVEKRTMRPLGYSMMLYSSMLTAIRAQLQRLPRQVVQLCWNYDDAWPSPQLGALLGWTNTTDFWRAFSGLYNVSRRAKWQLPPHYSVLLDDLLAAHEELKGACLDLGLLSRH